MKLEGKTISQVKNDPKLLAELRLRRLSLMSDAMVLMRTQKTESSQSGVKRNSERRKIENRFVHRASLLYRRKLAETIADKATALFFTQSITSSEYVDGKRVFSHRTEEKKDVPWSEREVVRRDFLGRVLSTFEQDLIMLIMKREYKKHGMLFPESRHDCVRHLVVKMPPDKVIDGVARAFIHEYQTARGYISSNQGYWELLQKMLTEWRIGEHEVNDAPETNTS